MLLVIFLRKAQRKREKAAKLHERFISTISDTTVVGQEQEEASVKETTVATSSV
jgi:hypothetical protein